MYFIVIKDKDNKERLINLENVQKIEMINQKDRNIYEITFKFGTDNFTSDIYKDEKEMTIRFNNLKEKLEQLKSR